MKRFAFLMLSTTLIFSQVCAQKTYYYKLTKKVVGGVPSTQVSGGQFICFAKNKLYECDKEGFTVNNGSSDYMGEENGCSVYMGRCYYGEVTIKCNSDKSALTYQVGKDRYIYTRATAPAGVTTCSLIKGPSSGSSGGGYYPTYPSQPTPQYPQGGYAGGNSGNSGSNSSSSSTAPAVSQPRQKDCGVCRGTGICQTCNGRGWYTAMGIGSGDHKCPNCNGTGRCSSCGGTGKW